jgi:hypothetical protein
MNTLVAPSFVASTIDRIHDLVDESMFHSKVDRTPTRYANELATKALGHIVLNGSVPTDELRALVMADYEAIPLLGERDGFTDLDYAIQLMVVP